ncbi:hypothetical protein BJY00DRAFT_286816 [Aspergillus carlsbadensis]|nr:hypothetical protein BJY00DRAFT_286816 [Aspergillus carlsbadensis]
MILRLPLSCFPLFTCGCQVRDVHLKAICPKMTGTSSEASLKSRSEIFVKLTSMKNATVYLSILVPLRI